MYRVGPGDLLKVNVFKEKELQYDVPVSPDGFLSFPLIGPIAVTDRTIPEVAALVAAELKAGQALVAPVVTVTLVASRSAQVQVLGEVGRQSRLPFFDRLTVVEAIAEVGGPLWATAKTEDVRIVRGKLDDPLLIEVDLDDLLVSAEKDVFLRPGDIVVVPPKYVTRFERYVVQLLSPISSMVGAGRSAASTAAFPP